MKPLKVEGGLFKSIDAGMSWSPMNMGLTTPSLQVLVLDPNTPTTLYLGTREGGIFELGEAETISIEIDGALTFAAAYGTSREDTLSVCGDTHNGFGLLVSWNVFGDGQHEVRAFADGVEFGQATVNVTTLGAEFLTGATGSFTLSDFPQTGTDVVIAWQETLQNFVITDFLTVSPLTVSASQIDTQALSMGVLENPQTNSFQSGIGVISGWLCEAEQVEIEIDGLVFRAAYGTSREDTRTVCGDADNGFGLLVNWNVFGDGPHEVRALADGEELSRASVEVTTFGEEFLTGVEGSFSLTDFPQAGTQVTVEWQEALQNFVITDVQSSME